MILRVMVRAAIAVLVVLQFSVAAKAAAEELIIPYACAMQRGEPKLVPALETAYKIVGARDEQPFSVCRSGSTDCTTMMVHRFAISCQGQRVAWAAAVNSTRILGVDLPRDLPVGFAPISSLTGRLVLPAPARTVGIEPAAAITTQDLSPDSVMDADESARVNARVSGVTPAIASWSTRVLADAAPVGSTTGSFGKITLLIAGMLAALIAAVVVASGRTRTVLAEIDAAIDNRHNWRAVIVDALADAKFTVSNRMRRASNALYQVLDNGRAASNRNAKSETATQAAAVLTARVAEVELLVATLPDGLLLRDVLQSEIDGIRARVGTTQRRRRASDKSGPSAKTLLRELDRIARIARSANETQSRGETSETDDIGTDHTEVPQTAREAYRLLGLNAEAPPQAAKKLVEALRMTWHPDYARDESDRRRREARMKQINAAWDLIKDRRAAA